MHYPYKYIVEGREEEMRDGIFFTSIHSLKHLDRVAEDAAKVEWLISNRSRQDWPVTFILFNTVDMENELGQYKVSLDFHALFTAHYVPI